MKNMYYILQGKQVSPIDDMTIWATNLSSSRSIGNDTIGNSVISTVFLGINHRHGEGEPLLFETMIFQGKHDQYQERYSTYEEAEEGHKRAVEMVKSDLN